MVLSRSSESRWFEIFLVKLFVLFQLFQDFARVTVKDHQSFMTEDMFDSVYEKPSWIHLKFRTNYKNEILLVAFGKGISTLIGPLKTYFEVGPGKATNVKSVYYINQKW